ncbi:MAG: hypothetical protein Q8M83_02265 [bacterium]|nr:hypothetical protein [bacterium]
MNNKNIRKLTRVSKRSLSLTLPIEMVRQLGWKEKQKVVVKKGRGCLVVRDWKRR